MSVEPRRVTSAQTSVRTDRFPPLAFEKRLPSRDVHPMFIDNFARMLRRGDLLGSGQAIGLVAMWRMSSATGFWDSPTSGQATGVTSPSTPSASC